MLPELWTMPGTGWPLKSYGFMMMVGFLSAVYLAMRRANKVKCDPDVVLNCSFIALIAGVVGSRAFYVWHYWDDYFAHVPNKLFAIVNITQGGLEFLGGLLAASLCILIYLGTTKRSIRVYTDILAVSTMWALGIARIGCFLNGCCFGGVCTDDHRQPAMATAVQFPFASPALVRQWEQRQITLPAELISDGFSNSPTSYIWEAMPVGREVLAMTPERRDKPRLKYEETERLYEEAKQRDPKSDETKRLAKELELRKQTYEAHRVALTTLVRAQQFPSRVDPTRDFTSVSELRDLAHRYPAHWVHPTQLYATVAAILLSVLLGRVFHRRTRHGIVFAWLIILYPVQRFVLEEIRADNPIDTFGLTVSQAVSVVMFLLGWAYLIALYRFAPLRSPRAIPFVPPDDEEAVPEPA